MLREGLAMSPDSGVGEEMQEVEAELAEKEEAARKTVGGAGYRRGSDDYALESGRGRRSGAASGLAKPARSPSSDRSPSPSKRGSGSTTLAGVFSGLGNLLSLILSPAWVQTFVMTFLGEWGDRSQIATIAMAAGQDYWWVTFGAVTGHMFCTGLAVIGGRALAGRVSMRVGECFFVPFFPLCSSSALVDLRRSVVLVENGRADLNICSYHWRRRRVSRLWRYLRSRSVVLRGLASAALKMIEQSSLIRSSSTIEGRTAGL